MLYEVITSILAAQNDGNRSTMLNETDTLPEGLLEIAAEGLAEFLVITSYSIHYTKLYEPFTN